MNVTFGYFNPNIGHFLHQELQYLIDIIFKNKDKDNIINLIIPTYIKDSYLYRWHYGILNVLCNKNKFIIMTININNDNYNNLHIIHPASPMIINIEYIKYLQKMVFEYYNIPYNIKIPTYKVLYTRIRDTNRRHILNNECLNDYFDAIIDSMDMSFEEQVRLFSKSTHFVSVESGAHFVNIMFMQPYARALDILTRTDFSKVDNRLEHYDSWQKRFNTACLISEFNIDIKAITRINCGGAADGDNDMHDHIFVDESLKKQIIEWLNK